MKVRLVTVAVALLFLASSLYAADEMIPRTPKEKISYIQLDNDMKREYQKLLDKKDGETTILHAARRGARWGQE